MASLTTPLHPHLPAHLAFSPSRLRSLYPIPSFQRLFPLVVGPHGDSYMSSKTFSCFSQIAPSAPLVRLKANSGYAGSPELQTDGSTYPADGFQRPGVIAWEHDLANKVYLIGRLGRDIDLKYLDTGKVVATSSLAVNRMTLKPTNNECMWFELQFWEGLAEIAAAHLKKGELIFVSGRVTLETYMSKDNVPKMACKVVVKDVRFVGDKSSNSGTGGKASVESLWRTFFENPTEWWDNRNNKLNPKSPDFKHKRTGDGLWIDGRRNPDWVKQQLAKLELRVEDGRGEFKTTVQTGGMERKLSVASLWQTFFANPSEWWDNRANKRNPMGPDFKHKSTGEALWIEGRNNPDWVNSQLAVLESRVEAGGAEAKAAVWSSGRSSQWSNSPYTRSSLQDDDFDKFQDDSFTAF